MNFPTNLLFDIELATSGLKDAFNPATASEDRMKRPAASGRMGQSPTRSNESCIPRSLRLPEVSGCAHVSFQAL